MAQSLPNVQQLGLLGRELLSMPQRGISKARLGQIALKIVSWRTAYEAALQRSLPKRQEQQLKDALKRLDELERLVAKLDLLRRVRVPVSVGSSLGSPPKTLIAP